MKCCHNPLRTAAAKSGLSRSPLFPIVWFFQFLKTLLIVSSSDWERISICTFKFHINVLTTKRSLEQCIPWPHLGHRKPCFCKVLNPLKPCPPLRPRAAGYPPRVAGGWVMHPSSAFSSDQDEQRFPFMDRDGHERMLSMCSLMVLAELCSMMASTLGEMPFFNQHILCKITVCLCYKCLGNLSGKYMSVMLLELKWVLVWRKWETGKAQLSSTCQTLDQGGRADVQIAPWQNYPKAFLLSLPFHGCPFGLPPEDFADCSWRLGGVQ